MNRTSLLSLAAATCLTPAVHAQTPPTDAASSWTGSTIIVTGERRHYGSPDTSSATRP